MPSFKPAYLIHGDDHGRVGERRARLRAMAEAASGQSGVERWKDADVATVAAAMQGADPDALTVAFFAREDGRVKAPAALNKAVEKAGGQIAAENVVRTRDLPRWIAAQASELRITIDNQAAKALVAQVGERQQRLLRELEKLALEHGEGASIGVDEVHDSCASSAERKIWTLADALVAGDEKTAMRSLLELRQQGERLPSLLYQMVRRVRDALAIAEALAAGKPAAQVRKTLRMPSFAADRLIADVSRRDAEAYRRALELLADLEMESRGGGGGSLSEDTAAGDDYDFEFAGVADPGEVVDAVHKAQREADAPAPAGP